MNIISSLVSENHQKAKSYNESFNISRKKGNAHTKVLKLSVDKLLLLFLRALNN